MSLRWVTKSHGLFPNDDALIKLYYLALRNVSENGRCRFTEGGVKPVHQYVR